MEKKRLETWLLGLIVWKSFRTTVLFLGSSRGVGPGETGKKKAVTASPGSREFCSNGTRVSELKGMGARLSF